MSTKRLLPRISAMQDAHYYMSQYLATHKRHPDLMQVERILREEIARAKGYHVDGQPTEPDQNQHTLTEGDAA